MEHIAEPERPRAILYDEAGDSLADFREELEQTLESSVFEYHEGKKLGGAGTPFPTLELILAFVAGATSTIISSALSELGKDIYQTLKGKLFKKPFENDSTMVIIPMVVTPEMVVIGRIKTDNHNDAIEGLKNVKAMYDDASKIQLVAIEELSPETIRDRDKLITETCNIVYHYEYDASEAKWVLTKIARIVKAI